MSLWRDFARLVFGFVNEMSLLNSLWKFPYVLPDRELSVGSELVIETILIRFGPGRLCDQVSRFQLERYE
jgi:hypothetical protein